MPLADSASAGTATALATPAPCSMPATAANSSSASRSSVSTNRLEKKPIAVSPAQPSQPARWRRNDAGSASVSRLNRPTSAATPSRTAVAGNGASSRTPM